MFLQTGDVGTSPDQPAPIHFNVLTKKIRFLVFRSGRTGFSEKLRPLLKSKPHYVENWEVTVDLSNRFAPASEIPEAAIGLRIVSPGNPSDFLETALLAYRQGANTVNPVYSTIRKGLEKYSMIQTKFAALRIHFDSVKKVLSCDYDADGAVNGYSWTRFASYGINASTGHTDDADWGLSDATREFGIFLYSYRTDGSDIDGLVSLDDFRSSVGRGGTAQTLDKWLVMNYGSKDVPEAALNFDRDLDGLSNLAEYAFGTNPKLFDAVGAPGYAGGTPCVGIEPTADFPRLKINYTRRKSALPPSFIYQPQFTSTLSGAWENATFPETACDLGGGLERVTVTDHVLVSPRVRFGRVMVNQSR